jgi:hypothetical protein
LCKHKTCRPPKHIGGKIDFNIRRFRFLTSFELFRERVVSLSV